MKDKCNGYLSECKTYYIIPLTQGKAAKVDIADYERIKHRKWHFVKHGYARTCSYKLTYMHRMIMDADDNTEVDHINGNRLDNRRQNLRLCNAGENARNACKCKPKRSSRFKGVYWRSVLGKWAAAIVLNRKIFRLGVYEKEEDAAIAYNRKAVELHGEFAVLNIVT